MEEKQRRKAVVNIAPNELVLNCEWLHCKETFSCMETFTLHVTEHLKQFITEDVKKQESFPCQWRECNGEVDGEDSDFMRHVFFHTFHVKIKCIGALLMKKTGSQACTLDHHCRNMIPELPERLECGWDSCHQFYDNAEQFYRHVENHTAVYPDGNNIVNGCVCQWEGCRVKVKSRYKLRDHLRSHTQEKVVACPTCGTLFASRTKYFDHVTRQMEVFTGKRYQCSHCNRTFPLERLLRDHMRNHVNQYKCLYCDMTLPHPSGLKKHMRFRHGNEKPYKCDTCDFSTKTSLDLKRHIETHSSAALYKCQEDGCSYSTRCYATFTSHIKNVHQQSSGPKYQCHVCSSSFTRGSKLTKHLKKNHKFSWPSGHSRFRYSLHSDGLMRLQTVRYETVDISSHSDALPDTGSQQALNQDGTSSDANEENQAEEEMEPEVSLQSTAEDVPVSENIPVETYIMNNQEENLDNIDYPVDKIIIETSDDKNIDMKDNMETADQSMGMVELSITKTKDGKYLLKTAGCDMEEPMTIMMSDYSSEELQENMYNLQMLGDVALQNQAL